MIQMSGHAARRLRHGRKPPLSDPAAALSRTRIALVALAAAFALKLAVMLQLKDHPLPIEWKRV